MTESPGSSGRGRVEAVDLSVSLGALTLSSPVMAASGTFGSGVEAQQRGVARVERLGAVVAKTVTQEPRSGNPHPRMAEAASGMLNSIGLQNPGIDAFLEHREVITDLFCGRIDRLAFGLTVGALGK